MASLEERIDALTAATNRLADLMEANGGGGSTGTTAPKTTAAAAPKTTTKKPAASKPTKTAEDVKAAVVSVKDTISPDDARAIIEAHAGAGKKLADLITMPAKFDAVCQACADALAAAAENPEEEEAAEEDDGL